MSTYTARVEWERNQAVFTDNRYSRAHVWHFDGGVSVPASSSPHVVPLPYSNEANVDPEEALVAALSSCHMLSFLSIAAKRGFVVDLYRDDPTGVLEKNAAGKLAMTRVTLHPKVVFSGERTPTDADVDELHHLAHEACFIANSVRTVIEVQGEWERK